MAVSALTLRMKYRKLSADKLNEIINNEESSELEVKIAKEFLEKLQGSETTEQASEQEQAPKPKKAPKKAAEQKKSEETESFDAGISPEDGSREAAMARQNARTSNYESEEQLTPEEEARLKKAEEEFDERQKNRKTPSKSDKAMKRAEKKEAGEKTERETKRQNIEESSEVPGVKVGSKVKLKGGSEIGEITRLYKSGDGKEKCMVKFGDNKPIKKRVTAVELAEETGAGKKTPKKK